jgi:hypothetical protein
MTVPRHSEIRFRVDPGDVPPEKAARRLHLTLARFNELQPNLRKRGFPAPDPDTGMFDLEEIDRWRRARHHPEEPEPAVPAAAPKLSMEERFLQVMKQRRETRKRGRRESS